MGFGYCPHPVTVYTKGQIQGYTKPPFTYCPPVTEWGQYPRYGTSQKPFYNPSILLICSHGELAGTGDAGVAEQPLDYLLEGCQGHF